jgi:hypothetical protein
MLIGIRDTSEAVAFRQTMTGARSLPYIVSSHEPLCNDRRSLKWLLTNHLLLLDALGKPDSAAVSVRTMAKEVGGAMDPVAKFEPTEDPSAAYVREEGPASEASTASLGERGVREFMLEYEAAEKMGSLRRIDTLHLVDALRVLSAAYCARPSSLQEARDSEYLNVGDIGAKKRAQASEIEHATFSHLGAVARGADRKTLHASAMELMERTCEYDRSWGGSRGSPERKAAIAALIGYYNFLASHGDREDPVIMNGIASVLASRDAWIARVMKMIMHRQNTIVTETGALRVAGREFFRVTSYASTDEASRRLGSPVQRTELIMNSPVVDREAQLEEEKQLRLVIEARPDEKKTKITGAPVVVTLIAHADPSLHFDRVSLPSPSIGVGQEEIKLYDPVIAGLDIAKYGHYPQGAECSPVHFHQPYFSQAPSEVRRLLVTITLAPYNQRKQRDLGKAIGQMPQNLPRAWQFRNGLGGTTFVLCGLSETILVVEHMGSAEKDEWRLIVLRGAAVMSGLVVNTEMVDDPEVLVYARWVRDVENAVLIRDDDGLYHAVYLTTPPRIGRVAAAEDDADVAGGDHVVKRAAAESMWQSRQRASSGYLETDEKAFDEFFVAYFDVHFSGLYLERLDWKMELPKLALMIRSDNLDGLVCSGFGQVGPNDGGANVPQWNRARAAYGTSTTTIKDMSIARFGRSVARWIEQLAGQVPAAVTPPSKKGEVGPLSPPHEEEGFSKTYRGCCVAPKGQEKERTAKIIVRAGEEEILSRKRPPGEQHKTKTLRYWLQKLDRFVDSIKRERAMHAPAVLEAVIGASAEMEKRALAGEKNPWPESVAECLATNPTAILHWIYQCLSLKILRETRRRIEEALTQVDDPGDPGTVRCSTVLYVFELVNAATVDYDTKRSMAQSLAELASGFFMRREQQLLLERIGRSGKSGMAWQLGMGAGKTSFIVPTLVFEELLSAPRRDFRSVVILVPEDLAVQSTYLLRRASAVLGLVAVTEITARTLVTRQTYAYGSAASPNRAVLEFLSRTGYSEMYEDVDAQPMKPSGSIVVAGDKGLQKLFLELSEISQTSLFYDRLGLTRADLGPHDTLKGHLHYLLFARLAMSLVICDEVDSVVDPMTCEMNVPVETSLSSVPHIREISRRVILGDEKSKPSSLSDALLAKMGAMEATADGTPQTKGMVLGTEYGFGTVAAAGLEETNWMMAIPYRGAHNPMDGSQFTDFELRLILTHRCYMESIAKQSTFRECDLAELIQLLLPLLGGLDLDHALQLALPDLSPEARAAIRAYIEGADDAETSRRLSRALRNMGDPERTVFAQKFAATILRKFAAAHRLQTNVGTLEFLSPRTTKRCVVFSGTVNVHLPRDEVIKRLTALLTDRDKPSDWVPIRRIREDKVSGPLTEAVLSGFVCPPAAETPPPAKRPKEGEEQDPTFPALTVPTVREISISTSTEERADIEKKILDLFTSGRPAYDALIDAVGALRAESPLAYARKLAIAMGVDVLFVTETGERSLYSRTQDVVTRCTSMVGLASRTIIFYDQKSTVGIDFGQPSKMRGLVIVDGSSTLTSVSQATFRLRRLSRGHSIDFLLITDRDDPEAADFAAQFRDHSKIIDVLRKREIRRKKTSDPLAQIAIICCAMRTASDDFAQERFRRRVWTDSLDAKGAVADKWSAKIEMHSENWKSLVSGLFEKASAEREQQLGAVRDLYVGLCGELEKADPAGSAAKTAREFVTSEHRALTEERQREKEKEKEKETENEKRTSRRWSKLLMGSRAFADAFKTGALAEPALGEREEEEKTKKKRAEKKTITKFVAAARDNFKVATVSLAFDLGFVLVRRALGITPIRKMSGERMKELSATHASEPIFAVVRRSAEQKMRPAVYACSDIDAMAMMHLPVDPLSCVTLYSSTGVRLVTLRGAQLADPSLCLSPLESFVDEVSRALCFRHPTQVDLEKEIEARTKRYPKTLRDAHLALSVGRDRRDRPLKRFGNPLRAKKKKKVAEADVGSSHYLTCQRCKVCGRSGRFACALCDHQVFCSSHCHRTEEKKRE